jgi:protein-L-isoaspartate(D-aspartate) O-methyltransferase
MVARQLAARDIVDERVLAAAGRVPRHRFVPDDMSAAAYDDRPLPIGSGATISQPYIVALMVQALGLTPGERVLEVGTGSGYGAAMLAELGAHVVTIECVPELAAAARTRLEPYGDRVEVILGDGSGGHPEGAPYDGICVTAAAPRVPEPLVEQLGIGGRLVIPVDVGGWEDLVLVTRTQTDITRQVITQVRFVPLTGRHGV